MRTSKSCATVDYNTDEFLQLRLAELVRDGVVDFWAYIEHHPEEDESKSHKHLFVVPSRLLDTSRLVLYLKEADPDPLKPPLGCIQFRSSKFSDWFLYALHDEAYLVSKGQSRKYHYTLDDFVVSDPDYFAELRHTVSYAPYVRFQRLVDAARDGVPFDELVRSGFVPVQQIHAYEHAFFLLRDFHGQRSGRSTHTPKVDNDE